MVSTLSSNVTCNEARDIFNNTTPGPITLNISANDDCPAAVSTIEVIDFYGNRIALELFDESNPLKDKPFSVPAGGKVVLFCDGFGDDSNKPNL